MILRPDIEAQIVRAIEAQPNAALTLPQHAYGADGRVVVLVDGIPTDLHRYLHNILIRPLGYHERMTDQSGVAGNVNPHLFTVRSDGKRGHLSCPNGHPYEGNEAPPNSRRIRCLTCLKTHYNAGAYPGVIFAANAAKTHCPHNHEYTPENTYYEKRGKRRVRRCRACILPKKRDAAAARRARLKETS